MGEVINDSRFPHISLRLTEMPEEQISKPAMVELMSDAIRVIVARTEKHDFNKEPSIFVERTTNGMSVYVHRDDGDPALHIKVYDDGRIAVDDTMGAQLLELDPDA